MCERELITGGWKRTGPNLLHRANSRDFSVANVFFWNQNLKSKNFMHFEWSEEKFLIGGVGHQMKLCFWNKLEMTDLLLMQLVSYRYTISTLCLDRFDLLVNVSGIFFDTSTVFYAFYCSAPAAWIKVLSFSVCFKSVASFCHPQYLLTTCSLFNQCAWNSRIWHFYLKKTLLPRRNLEIFFFRLWGLNRWNWLVNFVDFYRAR